MPSLVNILSSAEQALAQLLAEVAAIERVDVRRVGAHAARSAIDLLVHLTAFGQRHRLAAAVIPSGQPRHVRAALLSLQDHVRRQPDPMTPILIAPYLSSQAQDLCRRYDVAYLDLEGNARLAFGTFFLSRQSAAKPPVERRALRSLFKPKSAQVLKIMLRKPSLAWRVAPLAQAAGVSLGLVSNVRTALLDREWAGLSGDGMYLNAPDTLLDAWRRAYEPPMGSRHAYYTALHGRAFDVALRGQPSARSGHIALASFSAAQWLAPFGRTGTQYFYADAAGAEFLRTSLKLSTAGKGENVMVTVLDDPGLFRDTVQPAPGVVCTSPVQTYLDLAASGERGQEAADHLRQEWLQWQD